MRHHTEKEGERWNGHVSENESPRKDFLFSINKMECICRMKERHVKRDTENLRKGKECSKGGGSGIQSNKEQPWMGESPLCEVKRYTLEGLRRSKIDGSITNCV